MFEAIGEFVLHSTIYALVGIYKIIRYIFSKSYRKELKKEWKNNYLDRVSLTFALIVLTGIISFAFWFWGNLIYEVYFKEKTKEENIISQKVIQIIENDKIQDFIEFVKSTEEK
jgi:hypothetical protein